MQTLAVGISSSSISLLSLSLTCRQCLPVFPFHLQQQLARGHWQHSQLSPVALVLKTQTHLLLAQSHLLRLRIGDYDQVQLMEINLQLQLGWLNFVAHWEGLEKRLQLCLRTGPHSTDRSVRNWSDCYQFVLEQNFGFSFISLYHLCDTSLVSNPFICRLKTISFQSKMKSQNQSKNFLACYSVACWVFIEKNYIFPLWYH